MSFDPVTMKIELSDGANQRSFVFPRLTGWCMNVLSRHEYEIHIKCEEVEIGNMRIVTVYLKGPWAADGKDWDRGVVREEGGRETISLQDNEYGKNIRQYPLCNVARVEETGHW